jgi:hypothetical protein
MAQHSTRKLFFAFMAGAVGGALVASLRPALAGKARPAAKSAVRAGILAYEEARQVVAEWTETASDIIAETQAELEIERQLAASSEPARSEQVVPFEIRPASEAEKKLHA